MSTDLIIPDDLSIPAFLIFTREERRKAWEGRGFHSCALPAPKSWDQWVKEKRAIKIEKFKEKNAAGLKRLMAKHEGERYDRKLKQWVTK